MERFIENTMYASRWLLAPIYFGLSLALLALTLKFFQEVYHLLPHVFEKTEAELILVLLSMIDMALVGGVSLPLGSARRAGPEIRAAEAELAALEIEREARDVALYSTLTDAHGRYRVAQLDVARTRTDVLPRLLRAEQAAERAYRGGAFSYLEWAQLQSETTATRRQQLDAALDAQAALIEIQRLTGQAFVAAPAASPEGTTP